MPANDIVVEGSFKVNTYTVTYMVDGEQYGDVDSYESVSYTHLDVYKRQI